MQLRNELNESKGRQRDNEGRRIIITSKLTLLRNSSVKITKLVTILGTLKIITITLIKMIEILIK